LFLVVYNEHEFSDGECEPGNFKSSLNFRLPYQFDDEAKGN